MKSYIKYIILSISIFQFGCAWQNDIKVMPVNRTVVRMQPESLIELIDAHAKNFAENVIHFKNDFSLQCAIKFIDENPEQSVLASRVDSRILPLISKQNYNAYLEAEQKVQSLILSAKTTEDKIKIRQEIYKIIRPLKALKLAAKFDNSFGVLSNTTIIQAPLKWYKSCANWSNEIGLTQYAIKYATKALVVAKNENNLSEVAKLHILLSKIYIESDQLDLARYHAERAIDSKKLLSQGFQILGNVLCKLDRTQRAKQAYLVAISETKKNSIQYCKVMIDQINVLISQGEIENAEKCITQIRQLSNIPVSLMLRIDITSVIASAVKNPSRNHLYKAKQIWTRATKNGDYKYCMKYKNLTRDLENQYHQEHKNIRPKLIDKTRNSLLNKEGEL